MPPRDYELVAELLASLVESVAPGGDVVDEVARSAGHRLGAAAPGDAAGDFEGLLAARGYEPYRDPDDDEQLLLRNCPFHHLARDHRELVCSMNRALLEGVLDELGSEDMDAVLDPAPGRCCVAVRPTPSS